MRVQPQMAPHHDTESQLHMVSSVSNETFSGKVKKMRRLLRTRERGSKGVVVSLRTLGWTHLWKNHLTCHWLRVQMFRKEL